MRAGRVPIKLSRNGEYRARLSCARWPIEQQMWQLYSASTRWNIHQAHPPYIVRLKTLLQRLDHAVLVLDLIQRLWPATHASIQSCSFPTRAAPALLFLDPGQVAALALVAIDQHDHGGCRTGRMPRNGLL